MGLGPMRRAGLFALLLAACSVAAAQTNTPAPSRTPVPTKTRTPTQTPTATPTVGPATVMRIDWSSTVMITAAGAMVNGLFISNSDAVVSSSGGEIKGVLGRSATGAGQSVPVIVDGPVQVWGAASTNFPRGATVASDGNGRAKIAATGDFVAGYVSENATTGSVPGPIRIVLVPGVAVLPTFTVTRTSTATPTRTNTPTRTATVTPP